MTPPKGALAPKQQNKKVIKRTKKPRKRRSESSDSSGAVKFQFLDTKGVHNVRKLLAFIEWYVMPDELRVPRYQKDFAALIRVDEDVLTFWKKRDGFVKELDYLRPLRWGVKFTSKVFYRGFVKPSYAGNDRAAMSYAKVMGVFKEKIGVENLTPRKTFTPEQQEQLAVAMDNMGLGHILKKHQDSESKNGEERT